MNDIGESLQSEELRGAEEGEQTGEELSIFRGEEEGPPQSPALENSQKLGSWVTRGARTSLASHAEGVRVPPTPA